MEVAKEVGIEEGRDGEGKIEVMEEREGEEDGVGKEGDGGGMRERWR